MSPLQEVFNKATAAVIAQGVRSSNGDEAGATCLYRGPNGIKCAVGHLLSDEQMRKYEVANAAGAGSFTDSLLQEIAPDTDLDTLRSFLDALQGAHDSASGSCFVETFKRNANAVAKLYDLDPIK